MDYAKKSYFHTGKKKKNLWTLPHRKPKKKKRQKCMITDLDNKGKGKRI